MLFMKIVTRKIYIFVLDNKTAFYYIKRQVSDWFAIFISIKEARHDNLQTKIYERYF